MKPIGLAAASLAAMVLGCHGALPKTADVTGQSTGNRKTIEIMTESTAALVTAHEALLKQFPGRKVGNITVDPKPEIYQVTLFDLTPQGGLTDVDAVRVLVNRQSGRVTEITAIVTKTPSAAGRGGVATISGRQAFDSALAALKGYETFDKEGRLTVELTDQVYRVTFPLLSTEKQSRGADYAFQVWIDRATAGVVKILVAS